MLINFSFRFFNQNYVLDSAVLHKGTIEDGHYFALVRETEHFWTLLDDSRVLKGLRNQFAQQMLDHWACILMYRLIGENKSQVDPEVMAELKRAYQGIDDNPQLDSSPRIVSQKRSIKPALLQPTTKQAVFEEDYDEGLQDLDQEIAQIRREMELTCDDYDMYSFLREHALQNLSLLPPGQPYCGLENGAMICYANAVLQMLFTCKDIRSYLLKHGQTGPIHQLLAELFALMEKEFYERVTPSINSRELFIEPFRVVRPAFSKGTMHDAQEFWTILMELVHQEANSPRNAIKPKESPVFISACEQWIHQRTFVDDSPLASLLMGQLESSLTCLTCGRLSRSWNAFWQLQLQLSSETNHDGQEMIRENTLSVSSCLAEFTMHEVSFLFGRV